MKLCKNYRFIVSIEEGGEEEEEEEEELVSSRSNQQLPRHSRDADRPPSPRKDVARHSGNHQDPPPSDQAGNTNSEKSSSRTMR
jgi:hypothetical protein